MPRFVVLRHDHPRGVHWDFMLETGKVLTTWALESPPEPGERIVARPLPDHRPAFLHYEGPIAGDRGSVTRWDEGTCELVERSEDQWLVVLWGKRLAAKAAIRRIRGEPVRWEFAFSRE